LQEVDSYVYGNNYTTVQVNYCFDAADHALPLAIYHAVSLLAIPAVIMAVCYTSVIKELLKSAQVNTGLTNGAGLVDFRFSNYFLDLLLVHVILIWPYTERR
jgi:hypothetical protein